MANRNNTGRTKNSHNYRPYDTSNSFVKRFTAKVSEILPQPTSWVSRFFSTNPKLNARDREELDEEEEDEEERQPPNKRLCFSSPDTNDYTHQNNISRLGDIDGDSGEISPIATSSRITISDEPMPGPSGLLPHHFPISSTPAIRSPVIASSISLRDKIPSEQERGVQQQQRDDASDESESTSGCSSLVPGTHPRQEPPTTPSVNLQSSLPASSIGTLRRLSATSTMQKTNTFVNRTSLNLSSSSQPAFDTYVFNNPLNRSGFRKRLLGEDSCFYPGNTTFGGSSARSPSSESLRVVTVKPSPAKRLQQDTIGSSALKILRALEQFSTPVLDAKKMPVRRLVGSVERGKRKAPQPYEELIFPSMPDLLRVKRREREIRAAERIEKATASTSAPAPPNPAVPSTSKTPYSIRVEDPKDKHVGSIKGRDKDKDFESERVPTVNLPNQVKLQLSSLPKLDLKESGRSEKATQKPRSSPPVKTQLFKFSEPLNPLQTNRGSGSMKPTPHEKPLPPSHQMRNPSPNFKPKRKSSEKNPTQSFNVEAKPLEVKGSSRSINDIASGKITSPKTSGNDIFDGSVLADKVSRRKDSSPGPPWECLKCALKNVSSDKKCKSCGLNKGEKPPVLKGFEGFTKPKDTWECKECFVNNKNSVDVCAACSTTKTGKQNVVKFGAFSKVPDIKVNDVIVSLAPLNSVGFGIKTPTGSWECDSCLIKNKKEDLKCVACSAGKPGAKPTEEPKPSFSFGIPSSSSSVQSVSLPNTDSKPAQPQFSFGIPTDTTATKSNSGISFSSEQKKPGETINASVSGTFSSTLSTPSIPVVNSIKKVGGTWECDTCLIQNKMEVTSCVACSSIKPGCIPAEITKPTFTFGIPTATTAIPSPNISNLVSSEQSSTLSSTVISKPTFAFGNTSTEKEVPKSSPAFTFPAANSSNATNEIKPFSFMNSDKPKENEVSKPLVSTNLFSFGNGSKANKTNEMNDEHDDKPTKKRVSFGNPLTSEKSITNEKSEVATFGSLVPSKPAEIVPSSNFAFKPFENNTKVSAPASNSFFTFGAPSETLKVPNQAQPSKPLTFGGGSSESSAIANANSTFGAVDAFKIPETENKPFAFLANSQSGGFSFTNANHPEFGSQSNQTKPNSLTFGQQQQPSTTPSYLFSQPSQEPKPFVCAPAPFSLAVPPSQQPAFSITSAPSQPAPAGLGTTTNSGGFNFSVPVTTTKFDPNIKPTFNFTGGATAPTFNAAPSSAIAERKIKRGTRRLAAPR